MILFLADSTPALARSVAALLANPQVLVISCEKPPEELIVKVSDDFAPDFERMALQCLLPEQATLTRDERPWSTWTYPALPAVRSTPPTVGQRRHTRANLPDPFIRGSMLPGLRVPGKSRVFHRRAQLAVEPVGSNAEIAYECQCGGYQ